MIIVIKNILLLSLILNLIGCKPECIDPDDFGFPKLFLSSRDKVNINGDVGGSSNIISNNQNPGDQVMKWQDSGYVITGGQLTILVRNGDNSRWSFLYGTSSDITNVASVLRLGTSSVCTPGISNVNWASPSPNAQQICLKSSEYNGNITKEIFSDSCPNASVKQPSSNGEINYAVDVDQNTGNSLTGSCYFNKGVGAYGLITKSNPNANEMILRNPPSEFESFHLGENPNLFQDTLSGNKPPKSNNEDNYTGAGGYKNIPTSPSGSNLYFKILDHFYDDNAGGYQIMLKSGVEVPGLRPIAKVIKFVQTTFQGASANLYKNEVKNSDLQRIIKTLLTLYIIIQAICFIFGVTQASQAQFAIHLFKMAIIFQLVSDSSWEFFNNTAFKFFTEGVNTMICIITSGSSSSCSPETMFSAFDDAIGIVWSRETWMKAFSLFFVQIEGIVLIILLVICGVIFTLAVFKAIILFLVAYLATSLLVVLAPIFMPFLLFKATKHLFDNLISQFFNYFIQPIIVFASIGFWKNVIVTQLQKLLGFKICTDTLWGFIENVFFPRGVHVDPAKDLQWIYAPGVYDNPLNRDKICEAAGKEAGCSSSELSEFYKDQFQQSGTLEKYRDLGTTYSDYEHIDLRFPDLPFLQPYIQEDWDRIQQIASGYYVTFFDLFLFSILVYLMYLFNNMVPEISRGLSGGGGYGADIGAVASNAYNGLKDRAFDNPVIDAIKNKTSVGRAVTGLYDSTVGIVNNVRANYIGGVTSKIDEYTSPNKLAKKIPGVKDQIDAFKRGRDMRYESFSKIGGKYDATEALSQGLKENALYKASFGIMGQDYSKKNDEGRSTLDTLRDEYAHYHGIKGDDLKKLNNSVDTMSNSLYKIGRANQIAMAVSIVNPFVGGMISLVGTGLAVRGAIKAKREIDEVGSK